jgi:hypothetical protein
VTGFIDAIRSHVLALLDLAKFAVVVATIVGVPPLAARIRLPPMVGLLLFGVALGPHVLGFFGEHRPIADFFDATPERTSALWSQADSGRQGSRDFVGILANAVRWSLESHRVPSGLPPLP